METGGSHGLRDEGLLQSAVSAPFQSFSGTDAYPSLKQKAARLAFGLVKNHPFVDGNKRIGAHAMLVFLALNGVELEEFMEDALSASDAFVIDCSEGVELLENLDHHHEEEDHDGHDHGHFDPHIWMDPENAVRMV